MYLGLKNIQEQFSDLPTKLINSDGIHCLTGWTHFYNAPSSYVPYLLYAGEYTDSLCSLEWQNDLHLLCVVPKETNLQKVCAQFPEEISLLLVQSDDPDIVYSRIQEYFNKQCGIGMYGQTLLEFLAFEDGLQTAIEYSYQVFRNPIFVFDTNYNLIAATWNAIEDLGIQDSVILNKRFTDSDYKMASRHSNIHSRILKSEIPVRAYNEELGYEQMYIAINTRKNLGHIVVSAVNRPFYDIDAEFLLLLKKFVDQQMRRDSFVHNAKGFNYEYFLRDLLDEKITAGMRGSVNMKFTGNAFSGNLYCMVIETARSAEVLNIHLIRNMIESRFPYSRSIIYNGQIVTILSLDQSLVFPDEYVQAGRDFCKENQLFAGLSNCFSDIMDLHAYYSQALRAIEYGTERKNAPALFQYTDCFLDHVNGVFLQKESEVTFCHPKMRFLLDYDKKHHSELAYTLYMYLIYERNLAAASEAMNMHRTSLIYRFKKIISLIGEDYSDYKERLYLILSYEMNSKKSSFI